MTELKPCPFCGSEAEIDRSGSIRNQRKAVVYRVQCRCCHIKDGYWHASEQAAAKAWNKRAGGVCAFAEPTDLTDGCSLLKERTCRAVMAASKIASTCSECGTMLANWAMRYCPNCGRKVVKE